MNPLLFTDPSFLFFFAPVVLTGYWIVPARWRDGLLLGASLGLYAWGETRYVAVLVASILLNWACGLLVARGGKRALIVGIGANLALLAAFKYTPGFPVIAGVSFYTFIGISYLVDVHRRDLVKAAGLGRVGLCLAMFPHLMAGPIVRMAELDGQFGERALDWDSMALGVRRFVIGLGKKVLIANTLAVVPDAVFAAGRVPASSAWLALVCYTLQIYFDFSGYSDMAIGLARMLGYQFPENFNYPYVSRSITEFWRRWHMTLSNWLRDYLFFPLGVRGGPALLVRNLLIVFLLCGLWHGAAWTFAAWGLWHGVLLSLERLGLESWMRRRVPAAIQTAYTLAAVALGWVLFRASSIEQATGFVRALAGLGEAPAEGISIGPTTWVALAAGVVGAVPWRLPATTRRWAFVAEFAALSCVFLVSVATVAGGTFRPFIYFRF